MTFDFHGKIDSGALAYPGAERGDIDSWALGRGAAGAGIAPWLVGEKQGRMENKAQREETVAAVSRAEGPLLLGAGCVLCLDSLSCGGEISV